MNIGQPGARRWQCIRNYLRGECFMPENFYRGLTKKQIDAMIALAESGNALKKRRRFMYYPTGTSRHAYMRLAWYVWMTRPTLPSTRYVAYRRWIP